jgi:hypothetical protein
MKNITEITKAELDGYLDKFDFIEELIAHFQSSKLFEPKVVVTGKFPCSINQHTVYRIHTPCGLKGTAAIPWSEFENDY